MWSLRITLHTAQQCFIFSVKKMLHAPQVRFIKRFLISDKNLWIRIFFCPEFSYDGTAHSSVGELRQGKRNLFLLLFCLFRQTIEKSSVNNIIIALRFFFGLTENPVQKPEKSSASPPIPAGIFFCPNYGQKNMWSFWITLHTAQQCFIFSSGKCFMHRRCAS